MPPILALGLCLLFIGWLLRQEARRRQRFSPALWIPTLWFMIVGSRPLSVYLSGGVPSSSDVLEGSPVDRAVYLGLILACWVIVARRGLNWADFVSRNRALVLFYLFFALSVLWAAYPFVAFKRWFKDFGGVLIVLAILTEPNPREAIRVVFARCACILFPLSVLFIKYYPHLGRNYTIAGEPMVTGVTSQKNALGQLVMVCGLFLLWDFYETHRGHFARWWKALGWDRLILVLIGAWLLWMSQSKTSLVCFILGAALFLSKRLSTGKGGRVVLLVGLFMPLVVFGVERFSGFLGPLVGLLGRDLTFTGRTDIWKLILEQPMDPFLGTGFYGFWLTPGGELVLEELKLDSAHNGFLEMYLDGGIAGLVFLFAMLLFNGLRLTRLASEELFYKMGFAYMMVMIFCNLSESVYARLSLSWCALLLVMMARLPTPAPATVSQPQPVAVAAS